MTKTRSSLAIAAVAVATFFIAHFSGTTFPPGLHTAEANEAPPAAAAGDLTPMMKLESLVVNLNDEEETHYLKCALELQVGTAKEAEALTARVGIIRNELILLYSSLTFPDTRGEKAKLELLKNTVVRLNHALGNDSIKKAYFTDFVVQ